MEQINNIFPLIILDYYPLRIDMNENKNSIFMCKNIQEIKLLLKLYHKEIGEIVRNVKINTENETITFQVADTYFNDNTVIEESDWYNREKNFETLKTFNNDSITTI